LLFAASTLLACVRIDEIDESF